MALRSLRYVRLRVPNIQGPAFFKTPAVGLDIDRAAIKAVQGSRGPWSFALQHVGYRKLPAGAVSDLGLTLVQGQRGVPRGRQPNSNKEAANQVSLGQNEEELDSGDAESSAPRAENCDTDSYSAFESKDPFRLLKGIESKDGEDGSSTSGEAKNRDGKADNGKASVMGPTVARPATMAVTTPETLEILSTSRFPVAPTLWPARVVMGISSAAARICRLLKCARRDD